MCPVCFVCVCVVCVMCVLCVECVVCVLCVCVLCVCCVVCVLCVVCVVSVVFLVNNAGTSIGWNAYSTQHNHTLDHTPDTNARQALMMERRQTLSHQLATSHANNTQQREQTQTHNNSTLQNIRWVINKRSRIARHAHAHTKDETTFSRKTQQPAQLQKLGRLCRSRPPRPRRSPRSESLPH